MQVKLRLKSIEPVKSDQGLTITYVASSQQLGELELKIVTAMHTLGESDPADSGSALQEATDSEHRLLPCAAYRGSNGTSRIWQRINSRSDSRYASRPGR